MYEAAQRGDTLQAQAGLPQRPTGLLIAGKAIAVRARVAGGWGKKPLCVVHVLTV